MLFLWTPWTFNRLILTYMFFVHSFPMWSIKFTCLRIYSELNEASCWSLGLMSLLLTRLLLLWRRLQMLLHGRLPHHLMWRRHHSRAPIHGLRLLLLWHHRLLLLWWWHHWLLLLRGWHHGLLLMMECSQAPPEGFHMVARTFIPMKYRWLCKSQLAGKSYANCKSY